VRFALVYGLLAGSPHCCPCTRSWSGHWWRSANGLLHETPMEARTLSFERREDGGTYSYELRVGELGRRVERDMHAHGFVALLSSHSCSGRPGSAHAGSRSPLAGARRSCSRSARSC